MMTNEEIKEALQKEVILLYNCADDPIMKAKLRRFSRLLQCVL
jgi:hypothetical protein